MHQTARSYKILYERTLRILAKVYLIFVVIKTVLSWYGKLPTHTHTHTQTHFDFSIMKNKAEMNGILINLAKTKRSCSKVALA